MWKSAWRFLEKIKTELPYNPAISPVGFYSKKIKTAIPKDICTFMFTAVLFTIAKTWKQRTCPLVDERIKQMWRWKSFSHVWLFVTLWNSPWDSPGQNTRVGSLSLLQGIFPTQGSNPGLPHYRRILYQLSHQGSPRIPKWVVYPFSSRCSQPRNQTGISCTAGRFFTSWATREAQEGVVYIQYKILLNHTHKNEILACAPTWMDLGSIMLNKMSQKKTNTTWFHLYVESKKKKNKIKQSKMKADS